MHGIQIAVRQSPTAFNLMNEFAEASSFRLQRDERSVSSGPNHRPTVLQGWVQFNETMSDVVKSISINELKKLL